MVHLLLLIDVHSLSLGSLSAAALMYSKDLVAPSININIPPNNHRLGEF